MQENVDMALQNCVKLESIERQAGKSIRSRIGEKYECIYGRKARMKVQLHYYSTLPEDTHWTYDY